MPGRQQHADEIRRRNDLRDRDIEAHVRLKIDPLDRDPIQRWGLDILDPVGAGANRILAVGGDALLHFRRVEPGVLPDDCDHRDIDLRKNICRHHPEGGEAEKQDQHRQHREGVI